MPFAWTAISLRDILKEIEQETILSSHSNTLPNNVELINSANKASSLGKNPFSLLLLLLIDHLYFFQCLERRNMGTGGLRNAYESFRRSRDESLTRNNSRKSDEKIPSTLSTSINSSTNNPNLSTPSDEFFNILANFDRPIVINLKGVYKQVKTNVFISSKDIS